VVLQKWLDSGYIQDGAWYATKAGTPQGSPISPTIANMALDGLEATLQAHYGPKHRNYQTKVYLIRYADDFVLTGASKEVLEEAKAIVETFLTDRGLSLSAEKTRIVRIEEGFDFLGWTFRKFKGKLLIKPSKDSIKTMVRKLSTIILNEGRAKKQSELIRRLNQLIRGWTNYHKHTVASDVFSYVNNTLYILLQRWAKVRHPNKNSYWRLNKYWHAQCFKRWVFKTDECSLINLRTIPIRRHPKLLISLNPFIHADYFAKRKLELRLLAAARNGEETLEPYERETLTYGS